MFGNRSKPPAPGTPGSSPTSSGSTEKTQLSAPTRLPVGFETVIGANTGLTGTLTSHANVRIDGQFDGEVNIDGNLMVGETAHIRAHIHAHNITVAGAIHGNVSGNKVHLAHTGRIWGDISAAGLSTEEGAYLEGKITMASHPAARGDQPALSAPESNLTITGEDSTTGESVDVEFVEDPPGP